MRLEWFAAGLVFCLMAAGSGLAEDGGPGPQARLAEIQARQKAASGRFQADLAKVERTEIAQQPAIDRFHEALQRNVEDALDLARANPGDPAAFESKQSIGSGEIAWRCWWDGGTDGPITTRWGVSSFPSIFVLDRDGVIRFTNVRGDELDRAVASLGSESPPSKL